MRFPGFIGPSYTLQSVNVDCQRCVNLYPEIDEEQTGNEAEVASLVGTPGLRLLVALPTGPVRGAYTDSTGQLWAVGGNTIYKVSSAWVATAVGTLNTPVGPVSMADNGLEVVAVDGPYGYQMAMAALTPPNYMTPVITNEGTNTGNGNFELGNTMGWSLANSAVFQGAPTAVAAGGTAFSSTNGGTAASGNLSITASPTNPLSGSYSGLLSSSSASVAGDMLISSPFYINTSDQSSGLSISFLYKVGAGATPNMSGTASNSFAVWIYDVTNGAWIQPSGVFNITQSSGIGTAIASFQTTSNSKQYQIALVNINALGSSYNFTVDNFSVGEPGAAFAQITDPNFLGATHVAFMDGYFIFNEPNTQQFFLSPIQAVTPFSGLDVGTAEASPEPLLGHAVMQENVYLFSGKHLEIWYDSGNNNFPFTRIQGAVSQIGCAAAFSIATIQNTVYWLGQDQSGQGVVYSAQGLQPQRISTLAIETVIRSLGDLSGARAWTYEQGGHAFYCLNIPGASSTWVYDVLTGMWHERAHLSGGQFSRHQVDCHAFAYNTNVGGDFSNGNLYALDPAVFSDNSNPIVRERTAPHISKDTNRVFHSRFILDMERGTGLSGTGQGTSPVAMLQWSDDGGHSWSNEHWTSIGAIGVRKPRAAWRRLGHSRDRVYRVRISDPVKVTLLGAEVDLEEASA